MARLVTLATLQSRVLARCNLQTASNSAIAPLAEVTDCLNEGIAELWDFITTADQPYYLSSVTFATSSATDTYLIGAGQPIPVTDFYKPKGIDIQFGQNIVRTAYPFNWNERNRYKYLGGWVYTQPVAYHFIGKPTSNPAFAALDAVKLMPQPGGQFSCLLCYYPTPPVLAAANDTFDGVNGFEEHAVLTAAIKMLTKQEQFEHAGALVSERGRQEARILGALTQRDAENPPRVQDVTVINDVAFGRPGY